MFIYKANRNISNINSEYRIHQSLKLTRFLFVTTINLPVYVTKLDREKLIISRFDDLLAAGMVSADSLSERILSDEVCRFEGLFSVLSCQISLKV